MTGDDNEAVDQPTPCPSALLNVRAWLDAVRTSARPAIERIPLSESREWSVADGRFSHRSGGFFSVVALDWTAPDGTRTSQPYLDQREVGTLGFLLRNGDGPPQLLVQAKPEPGNVGLVQLAPTCQATASNVKRLHGGRRPPFADAFPPDASSALYDVPQSEQGTRFFHKQNRNVLALASGETPPPTHRWMPVDDVLSLLGCDHVINTDARSVLVCAPWSGLVERVPFSRRPGSFGRELGTSLHEVSRHVAVDEVKASIRRRRAVVGDAEPISVTALPSWRLDDYGLAPRGCLSVGVRRFVSRCRAARCLRGISRWWRAARRA
jgi:oxidase EvaA